IVGPAAVAVATPTQAGEGPSEALPAIVRQVCDLQWIDGLCEQFGYPDPQYRSATEPSLDQPYALRIGALHEHSGYSDGDPDMRPRDFFAAGRTGHNTADAGGDTGVVVDWMLSSEHSDNEKLPVTTAEVCINPGALPDQLAAGDLLGLGPLLCQNVDQGDHYDKWDQTLAQAAEATEADAEGAYTGFTAMRGFEFTNDYYNHLGVYFSRNVVNAKVDGSLLTTEAFWNWLREPSTRGGGDDALVVFNHPGHLPALSPFDSDTPLNQLLADLVGGGDWHDLTHVSDVDDRVAGLEVNGGDDLFWYTKALRNGWHLGPVGAEDEHQREWSSTADPKTVVLTRGRSPRDYYAAFRAQRTMVVAPDMVGGEPGAPATYPKVLLWADGTSVQDPAATVLGGTVTGAGAHALEVEASELPPGARVVLVSDALDQPLPIGAADGEGRFRSSTRVTAPATGEHWWFVAICQPSIEGCGTPGNHSVVTAPIWFAAGAAQPEDAVVAPGTIVPDDPGRSALPATGAPTRWPAVAAMGTAATALLALRRRSSAGI
ncbi:MAG: hypothetical protein M3Z03_02975, partial [Actinomycetota bacterium]|nr:hypothetical protein [Actinomycetota bacterium]